MVNPTNLKNSESGINPIPYVTKVSENDILMGRGSSNDKNEGNKRFRELVRHYKKEYMSTSRQQIKREIAMKIRNEITSRDGSFLRRIESQDDYKRFKAPEGVPAWCYVTEDIVIRKIKQALRGDEKPSQGIHQVHLQVSNNDVVANTTQRDNGSRGIGDDHLNERLQTYRSSEGCSNLHDTNYPAPTDTMEFSSISSMKRSDILESSTNIGIESSNNRSQFAQETQWFQNNLLLSRQMSENRLHYQAELPIMNPENLLLSQIEALQRNRHFHLGNIQHDVLLNTQAYTASSGAISHLTSHGQGLAMRERMQQPTHSTFEDQRNSLYVNMLLHEKSQDLLSFVDPEARAQYMLQKAVARSMFQHNLDANLNDGVQSSSNILYNEQMQNTPHNMQRVASLLNIHSLAEEIRGVLHRNDTEHQVEDGKKEQEVVEDLKISKRLNESSSSSSSSSARMKKRRRKSKHYRMSGR